MLWAVAVIDLGVLPPPIELTPNSPFGRSLFDTQGLPCQYTAFGPSVELPYRSVLHVT